MKTDERAQPDHVGDFVQVLAKRALESVSRPAGALMLAMQLRNDSQIEHPHYDLGPAPKTAGVVGINTADSHDEVGRHNFPVHVDWRAERSLAYPYRVLAGLVNEKPA